MNAVAGEDIMTVSGIREKDSKGRHTTTHRQLIVLPSQVTIIDTPGIRELGMWDAKEGIDETFSDIAELISTCKYSDCSHRNEPGCAIRNAIQEGNLTMERFQAYSRLVKENEWGKGKSAYTKRDKLIQKMRRS
ncbi:MAG TPA: GTPase RsgA [Lachnospiraceae bacterium]|nr:GTPase RsgA [Lachnospiraceae bacterium]